MQALGVPPVASGPVRPAAAAARWSRRAVAAAVLLLATAPLYALLRGSGAGFPGDVTARLAGEYAEYTWSGALLLVALALAAALLAPAGALQRAGTAAARLVRSGDARLFGLVAGAIAAFFAWLINRHVLYGEPTLIDALSQLVHARYLAAGHLAGPVSPFWHMQQTLATEHGWVSQYPPGHVALLALGMRLGSVELVGPLAFGLTVFVTSLLAHRLFTAAPVVARAGTALLALSPFAAAHAGAYMNHTTAALFATCTLYCAARLREQPDMAAAAALGGSAALLLATRPLTGVVVGVVAALLLFGIFHGRPRWPALPLLLTAAASAAPVLVLLGVYNAHFFGSPFRFGYIAALGPDCGLGFGADPWGNAYGLRAALGFTAAELHAMNLFLLETPLPAAALAALWLLAAPVLGAGARVAAAWALLPLAAHLFYWHHGLHIGPRMLNEYAPAWCLLLAAAGTGLLRLLPAAWPFPLRGSPRGALALVFTGAAAYALAAGIPNRLESYRRPVVPVAQVAAQLPAPSLVFIHGSWPGRVAMDLAAGGMRLDSLETLMRVHSTCAVQQWAAAGRTGSPADFEPAARTGGVGPQTSQPLPPACRREAQADEFGVLEVSAYLWRAGLPGISPDETMLVRDLGPTRNAQLIAALRRPAYVLELFPEGDRIALQPYGAAIGRIWGET